MDDPDPGPDFNNELGEAFRKTLSHIRIFLLQVSRLCEYIQRKAHKVCLIYVKLTNFFVHLLQFF